MSVAVLTIAPGLGHLSPAHSLTFDNADDPILNQQHQRDKAKRVSKYIASFKQLKVEMNLKSNPVTSAQNFDHQHDFPDDRQTVACA